MSAASEARDRLAALLPGSTFWPGGDRAVNVTFNLMPEQALALADRLAEGDAAVAERDRLREYLTALCDDAEQSSWAPGVVAADALRRALAAPAADHESGATDG